MMIMDLREWLLGVFGCNKQYWIQQSANLSEQVSTLIDENTTLKNQVYELQKLITPEDDSVKPTWLDTSQYLYKPNISLPEGLVVLEDPREIYCSNSVLKKIIDDNKVKEKTLDEKFKWIWYFVIDNGTYFFDVTDDWQFPIVSFYKHQMDCEDGTILFVELCRLAGIKNDSVFNACGWYTDSNNQKFGHSYPIIKTSDGIWKIAETTLDYKPSDYKIFKGSNYGAEWGCYNWKYAGAMIGTNQV